MEQMEVNHDMLDPNQQVFVTMKVHNLIKCCCKSLIKEKGAFFILDLIKQKSGEKTSQSDCKIIADAYV